MSGKTSLKTWLVMAMFLIAIGGGVAAGQIIYVDVDSPGINDGSSWTDALNYLQDALADANSGDEVRVAQGIYKPDQGAGVTTGDRTATFQLMNGVNLKGGYAGYGQPDPNARDVHAYETILSGDLDGNDIDVNDPCDLLTEPTRAENSYHVVTSYQTDTMDATTDLLDGFTISGGNANDSSYPNKYGGGMFCNSDATLVNCTFTGNSARKGGGILCGASWCCATYPTVTNCTFIGNSAGEDGGGMWVGDSDPTLTNCRFSDNFAKTNGGGQYYNGDSWPTLTNCLFSGNSAGEDGGGMYCLFTYYMTLTNCTLSGNSAGKHGGGMYNRYYSPTLTNCTFSENWAGEDGGGICHCYSRLTVTNCILWANSPSQISQDDEATASITYSDVQGGWPGEGNIDADPCFVDLGYWAYKNDPNIIVEPNDPNAVWVEGDYHLKSQAGRWLENEGRWTKDDVTSLCIDGGDMASPIGYEPFPNGGIINMGAYGGTVEASKSYFGQPVCETIVAGDINGDCKVNFLDFRIMAFHWLRDENQ